MRRTILSALALVIAFGFASEASANQNNVYIGNTAWVTSVGNDAQGFAFRNDGVFVFAVSKGGQITDFKGSYTIEGNTIHMYSNGEHASVQIVSLNEDTMVLHIAGRGQVTWYRVRQ